MKKELLINELADTLSLDGTWDFRLRSGSDWGKIQAPGCWEKQGYPKNVDGPAYYRREVLIPGSWAGKTILAQFKAVSYACEVNLNGTLVGKHRALWTPFSIDLSKSARAGEINILDLCVYKPGERYPVRSSLAGFLPDVATTFGGIWQRAGLMALDYAIQNLRIEADVERGSFQVRAGSFGSMLLPPLSEWLVKVLWGDETIVEKRFQWLPNQDLEADLSVPEPLMWQPGQPALYTVEVWLEAQSKPLAKATQKVGFRRLSRDGGQLLLNGQPFMVRGVLSWGWDPQQIAPCFSKEQIRAEIQRLQELGFNLIKLCLFVPNPEYYQVADELGMLIWQEWPMWLPEVTPEFSASAPEEYAELFELTRSHPSVALYSLGCELDRSVGGELLGRLNTIARQKVSDVLICDNSGSGESYGGLDYDFSDFSDYHPYFELHYLEPLLDNWRRDWKAPRPLLFGEFCDADTFRQLDKIMAANGGQQPWWMTQDNPVSSWRPETQALIQAKERLANAKLDMTADDLVRISYAQALTVRKFTLEAIRRRTGIGGYVITGLRDTPIASSGIFDDFGQAKWPAGEYRTINDDSILCLETSRRRRWSNGGDRPERLDPYDVWAGEAWEWLVILGTGSRPFPPGSLLSWRLLWPDGSVLASGKSEPVDPARPGQPQEVGRISGRMPMVASAVEMRLEVSFEGNNFQVANHWPVWVYPALPEPPDGLLLFDPMQHLREWGMDWTSKMKHVEDSHALPDGGLILTTGWDAELMSWVQRGGRALLLQNGEAPLPARRCPFWREAIKVFSKHPLWQTFPQKGYTDLQFYGLANDVAFDTGRLARVFPSETKIKPILRRLDAREFYVSDYIFEAQCGDGVVVGCSLNIQGGKGAQPSGLKRNAAGSWMLAALLGYLASV
jgi:hypothetical protein